MNNARCRTCGPRRANCARLATATRQSRDTRGTSQACLAAATCHSCGTRQARSAGAAAVACGPSVACEHEYNMSQVRHTITYLA